MTKRTTIFERWLERRRRARAPTEDLYLNPLQARVGSILALDLEGWDELQFQVNSLRQVNRVIGDQEYPFTDYFVMARNLEGEEFYYGLRYIPLDEPDHEAGITHRVFLLDKILEEEYSEELEDALHAGLGVACFIGDTEEADTWIDRVDGVDLPYECMVTTLSDRDHDGEVDRDEVDEDTLTLWDFQREVSMEGEGAGGSDFLFLEIEDSGFTTYYYATEIDPSVVRLV